MKKKNLIIVIASCVMLLAFLVFAYIKFGDKSTSMFDMMKNDAPIMAFLILLLLLLSPIYLLLDSFRENLKKNIPVVEKIVIPEKGGFTASSDTILLIFLLSEINAFNRRPNEGRNLWTWFLSVFACRNSCGSFAMGKESHIGGKGII